MYFVILNELQSVFVALSPLETSVKCESQAFVLVLGKNHHLISVSCISGLITGWAVWPADRKNCIWHALVAWAISTALATLDEMPSEKATSSHL